MTWRTDPSAALEKGAPPRGALGYSLLELLVVLTILALTIGLAPVAYSSVRPGLQARAAAMESASEMRRARAWSMRHAQDAVVTIDIGERRLVSPTTSADHQFPDAVTVYALVADSERLSDTVGGIRFFHDGGSTGGRIRFAAGSIAYQVDVDWLLGRITVERTSADAGER